MRGTSYGEEKAPHLGGWGLIEMRIDGWLGWETLCVTLCSSAEICVLQSAVICEKFFSSKYPPLTPPGGDLIGFPHTSNLIPHTNYLVHIIFFPNPSLLSVILMWVSSTTQRWVSISIATGNLFK